MRLPRFSTFPRFVGKMVDRRGYAPRTAGCKPADFLNNLAAHSTMVARRTGAAPVGKVLETLLRRLAPAAHIVSFDLRIGAISRNCTGIA
jgi:hypothetical protein